jgi:two-component system sensor histidine kinase HydH
MKAMAEGLRAEQAGDTGELPVRPAVLAFTLAAGYALLCGAYIALSGRVAARAATSVPELASIELLKGLVFVASTALLFFGFGWWLLHRLASRQRLVHRQQQALVAKDRRSLAGLFAASIAHDINNILIVANAHLDQTGPTAVPERWGTAHEALRESLAHLAALSKRLMALERGYESERREPVDMVKLARETVEFAKRHPGVRACSISVSAVRPLVVRGHPVTLARVILNLLLNAADATGGRGRIEIRVLADGDGVRLEVHDDGPGVPADMRERIFEGLVTTKPGGSGLGLLSMRVAAVEHGGRVALTRSDLGGACFQMWLPAEPPPR